MTNDRPRWEWEWIDPAAHEDDARTRAFRAAQARRDLPAMERIIGDLRADVDELAGRIAADLLPELLADLGDDG